MTDKNSARRNSKELDFLQDDFGTFYYVTEDGMPYTGQLFSLHNNGQLASEQILKDGYNAGWKRTWHENGVLKEEGCRLGENLHGLFKSWNEAGRLVYEGYYKYGRLCWSKHYNEAGAIVDAYDINNDPAALQSLMKWIKRLEEEDAIKDWDIC